MRFHQPQADVLVPDGSPLERALGRSSHLAIGAHQDDLEIMAADAIVACFQDDAKWFSGVVVTNGQNAPRSGPYGGYDSGTMGAVRREEQRAAAYLGRYSAMVQLDFPSAEVKASGKSVVADLAALLVEAQPEVVYTHNLADKHDTHVAVALRVIEAIRRLPAEARPRQLLGCEVWRDLDWMVDDDKTVLPLAAREGLQAALIGAFDSQVSGGKRYDLAVLGRRKAHATFSASHAVDNAEGLCLAMDMSPLMAANGPDPATFTLDFIDCFRADVADRIARFQG